MANTDWVGLLQRAKKAYRPTFGQTVLRPFSAGVGQGLVQRQTTQDALRQAIIEAMLKENQPMVAGQPATIEQTIAALRGKPGFLSRLLGAKPPEEITWEKRPSDIEERYTAMGKLKDKEYTLKKELLDKEYGLRTALASLTAKGKSAKTPEEIAQIQARTKLLQGQTELIQFAVGLLKPTPTETPESKEKKLNSIGKILRMVNLQVIPEAPEVPEVPEVPEIPETSTPSTELPLEIQEQIDSIRQQGGTEEDIQELLDYYRY